MSEVMGRPSVGTLPDRVDYDPIATEYDSRYSVGTLSSVLDGLQALARGAHAGRALEAGCGTGHWLKAIGPFTQTWGLDLSAGMLAEARRKQPDLRLVRGTAVRLPFGEASFDLVYCVSALHHFESPQEFLRETRRILRAGGLFCNIGLDPKSCHDRWYLYDYFPGTREADRLRYPSATEISRWLVASGFHRVSSGIAGRIRHRAVGEEVLADPILHKGGTSQLALLSETAYSQGMERIHEAIRRAEARDEEIIFDTDIQLRRVVGRLGLAPRPL